MQGWEKTKMSNELVYIDGQEGFVDLDILLSYNLFLGSDNIKERRNDIKIIKSSRGWYVYYDSLVDSPRLFLEESKALDFVDRLYWYDIFKGTGNSLKIYMPKRLCKGSQKNFDNSRRLLLLSISRNNIIRELSKILFDKKIKRISYVISRLQRSSLTEEYKKVKIRPYNSQLVNLLRDKKRMIMSEGLDYDILFSLINHIPEKYKVINNEIVEYNAVKKGRLWENRYFVRYVLNVLRLNTNCIPYLEQQLELGRITLSDDEINYLSALKEAMRIKDENMTFDDYIDNWTDKLLHGDKNS